MRDVIALLLGWLGGVATAHIYYQRGKADLGALQARFDALQAVVQRAIDQGLVSAERTASGDVRSLARPSAPTKFSLS
jgi:hypothetical protein